MASQSLVDLCGRLVPAEHGGPPAWLIASQVEAFVARLPRHAQFAFRAGVLAAGRSSQAFDAVKTVVLLVAGAEAGAVELAAWSDAMPVARPDPALDVTPAGQWPASVRSDVVVIGSGVGGASVARTLARAGLDVVVVEEGRRFTVHDFRTRHPLDRWIELYRDGGSTVTLGRPSILLPIGRAVGGTTVVNSGTCYQTPGRVLSRWRDRDGLVMADPAEIGPYLDDAWRTLAPDRVLPTVMGRNGELTLAGAAKLGWMAGPLDHSAVHCGGCCQSAIGCVQNAKGSVHLTVLPDACDAGARIVSEARVERVLHEEGRATGVVISRFDGARTRILAPRVVVAAGATETPPLLRRSGLGRHPSLGRNLSIHPALAVLARFEEPVTSWRGVLQSAGIEEFHRSEGILIEATSAPFGMGWSAFPGSGEQLMKELDRAEQYGSLGAMIADSSVGRVLGKDRAFVTYQLTSGDGRRLLRAYELIGEVLFAAGAVEVVAGSGFVRSQDELRGAVQRMDPRRLHLAAFHPVGTVRAGANPQRSPVAGDGRLRGVRGVWVADASILPSCPEVNPQVTIMALALAVADRIASGTP
jgi:choline dehydrogenase-like flavoprotein